MRVPFSVLPPHTLSAIGRHFRGLASKIEPFFPYIEIDLRRGRFGVNTREYLSMCIVSVMIFFLLIFGVGSVITYLFGVANFLLISLIIAFILSFFVFVQQTLYPKYSSTKRIKDIDRNLISALRTILIHINSGVPLFDTMVSISQQNFGAVSEEFKIIIRKVNSGIAMESAIEESAANNPSEYYRKSLWQLANGMKAGSTVNIILAEIIDNLSKEQLIQIERYGAQLNPLAMFYMLTAVILPALAITLLIILTSFVALSPTVVRVLFYGIYVIVLLFQITFLGMIKTRRPNLIEG